MFQFQTWLTIDVEAMTFWKSSSVLNVLKTISGKDKACRLTLGLQPKSAS